MNTKLHAVTDQNGRPLSLFTTAGPISDYTDASALPDSFPAAQWMLEDPGYDADWFRDALEEKGIRPCIPGRKSRGKPVKYDRRKYKQRNRIELMFGRLKNWRRVATPYICCAHVLMSAIHIPPCFALWLQERVLGLTSSINCVSPEHMKNMDCFRGQILPSGQR